MQYIWAPVAQLDRASASGVEGRGFESRRVYHLSKIPVKKRKSSLHKQVCRLFFFFYLFSAAPHPRNFLGGLPSLRSGSLRFARVESRRVYHHYELTVKKFIFFLIVILDFCFFPCYFNVSRDNVVLNIRGGDFVRLRFGYYF